MRSISRFLARSHRRRDSRSSHPRPPHMPKSATTTCRRTRCSYRRTTRPATRCSSTTVPTTARLQPAGSYATGGNGGAQTGAVVDPLASQGSVAYDAESHVLLVDERGSDSVSVFGVDGNDAHACGRSCRRVARSRRASPCTATSCTCSTPATPRTCRVTDSRAARCTRSKGRPARSVSRTRTRRPSWRRRVRSASRPTAATSSSRRSRTARSTCSACLPNGRLGRRPRTGLRVRCRSRSASTRLVTSSSSKPVPTRCRRTRSTPTTHCPSCPAP